MNESSILLFLGMLLVALKLNGDIVCSWWLVLLPFYFPIPLALIAIISVVLVFMLIVIGMSLYEFVKCIK